jgi:two-component sensor histidine kinase
MSGPDVLLLPNGATHIGLALHELIANAIGYGALSNGGGSIRIDCRRTGDEKIELLWDEDTGCATEQSKADDANDRNQFGSTVLQRVVPAALDAEAEYLNTTEHVRYRLRFVP